MKKHTAKESYFTMALLLFFSPCSSQTDMFVHDGEKVFIYIIATSDWRVALCPFSCHLKVGVPEPLAVMISLHGAGAGSWCSLWTTHPVKRSLRQACSEPVLFWKPQSLCKRAQYFNYSYLRQFLSQGFIFSHNKGWRKFSEWKSWTSPFHYQGLRDAQ